MKREVISGFVGVIVCLFVLWPLFLRKGGVSDRLKKSVEEGSSKNHELVNSTYHRKKSKKKMKRNMVGCIPIMKGKIFMINGRHTEKFIFPKGGQEKGEEGFYSAGKEALEKMGVIGLIDRIPIFRLGDIDWYVLKVSKVLPDWKERHERIRVLLDVENALLNAEVRATTKNVIKELIKKEEKKKNPRIRNSKLVI